MVCRVFLSVVYVSLSAAANVITLVVGSSLVERSLWNYIGIMCRTRLGGFGAWRIDVPRTTALGKTRSVLDQEQYITVIDILQQNMRHHLDRRSRPHEQFHRQRS